MRASNRLSAYCQETAAAAEDFLSLRLSLDSAPALNRETEIYQKETTAKPAQLHKQQTLIYAPSIDPYSKLFLQKREIHFLGFRV